MPRRSLRPPIAPPCGACAGPASTFLEQCTACIVKFGHALFRIHRLHPAGADVLRGAPDRRVTIGELADQHGLSKNHLMKVVNDLARQGWVETTRGRGGGLRLLAEPEALRIGDVVRASETDFRLVECFDPTTSACTLAPNCRLKHLFGQAAAPASRQRRPWWPWCLRPPRAERRVRAAGCEVERVCAWRRASALTPPMPASPRPSGLERAQIRAGCVSPASARANVHARRPAGRGCRWACPLAPAPCGCRHSVRRPAR